MSNQQRMRPNASPSTKPGPLRATVPVALMRQGSSPTNKKNSPTDSPTLRLPQGLRLNRQSPPENRINLSPERKCSPILQTEKGKPLRSGSSSGVVPAGPGQVIRRTASLDALHLVSPWTREVQQAGHLLSHTYCGRLMVDRATQTPDDWDEYEKKRNPRKSNESLEMRYMRQRLQRTSGGNGRVLSPQHQQPQRYMGGSPVGAGSPVSPSPQVTPPDVRAAPIPIPHIPKPLVPRLRNSVEGLNQEIEKLVLKETSGIDCEGLDIEKGNEQALDGHRAPIAKLFHCQQQSGLSLRGTSSVDTQTPSGGRGGVESSSSGGGSPSPPPPLPLLLIPGHNLSPPPNNGGISASPDGCDYRGLCGKTPSDPSPPRIEPFLAREPPDGCEKVKVMEEPSKQASLGLAAGTQLGMKGSLPRPCMNFVLMPSQRSAFCPLYKPFLPPSSPPSTGATKLSPTFNERLQ